MDAGATWAGHPATIDADLQVSLYEQFKEDKSCSVAMNPYTGSIGFGQHAVI